MLVPIWVLVGSNFYFGINTNFTISIATKAANSLIGTSP
jgi:hypothetical protein